MKIAAEHIPSRSLSTIIWNFWFTPFSADFRCCRNTLEVDSSPEKSNDGFVVKGNETIEFLEEKLAILGLNEIEAEEFIVYWLPKLQENEYNYIRFATMDEINKNMPLEFSVKPDTIIRVLMQYKGLDNYIEVKEQKLETPERTGFVAVEWGGTEIKQQNSIIR